MAQVLWERVLSCKPKTVAVYILLIIPHSSGSHFMPFPSSSTKNSKQLDLHLFFYSRNPTLKCLTFTNGGSFFLLGTLPSQWLGS